MKPSDILNIHRKAIRRIIKKHHTINVRVFGSVVRGEDTASSDLDLLVEPTFKTTLMDIAAIRCELRELLKVPVDVLTPKALPVSFRNQILLEARPV
ncbi:MAG: nucleotidyltransferase [Gammaproteobacteria bacterium GWE2_37_16]|nr:MAG: nucleotidyltransferase [Gammaproteobacteria bacterium GWE2_37_16]